MNARVLAVLLPVGASLSCGPGAPPSQQDSLCQRSCAQLECLDSSVQEQLVDNCESYCAGKFDAASEQGKACEETFSEGLQCLVELSCDGYNQWVAEEPASPCADARERVDQACDQIYLEPHILPP